MTRSEKWLKVLLRLGAAVTGSAIFAVFMPRESMAAVHAGLGLGELPASPITSYLTRSLSAMYALHGLVLLALSLDVRRHVDVVVWVGWGTAALGALQLGIDLTAPMPLWWSLAEGPWVVAASFLLIFLSYRVRNERKQRVMEGFPLKREDGGRT